VHKTDIACTKGVKEFFLVQHYEKQTHTSLDLAPAVVFHTLAALPLVKKGLGFTTFAVIEQFLH
jgi:hypothetical protein